MCTQPGAQSWAASTQALLQQDTNPGVGMEACPKQGVTVQAHSADARTTASYSWLHSRPSLRAAFAFDS